MKTSHSYVVNVARGPNIVGWDAASLAEFDRRWLAGEKRVDIAAAFDISVFWVRMISHRRSLPPRPSRWQGKQDA